MKVYILKCSNNSHYTGITNNLEQRIGYHIKGRGAEYTRLNKPNRLAYFEDFENKIEAEKRERYIKKLSRINKEHLIKYGKGVRVSLGSDRKTD